VIEQAEISVEETCVAEMPENAPSPIRRESARLDGPPRWVIVFCGLGVVALLVVVIIHLTGHAPHMHSGM
jgi:hypothetical protein